MSQSDQAYIEDRIGGFNNTQSIGGQGILGGGEVMDRAESYDATKGRYPANVLLDPEAAAALDEQSGVLKSGSHMKHHVYRESQSSSMSGKNYERSPSSDSPANSGGASRFFPVLKDQDKASKGRYPANVLLDESAAAALDEQTGVMAVAGNTPDSLRSGTEDGPEVAPGSSQVPTYAGGPSVTYQDRGGASRFFPVFKYQAKAPKRERPVVDGVKHPTVKPLALMDWLVTLITPPGGTVLDPFAGSGATLEAARDAGFNSIGMEAHFPYVSLILERLGENR